MASGGTTALQPRQGHFLATEMQVILGLHWLGGREELGVTDDETRNMLLMRIILKFINKQTLGLLFPWWASQPVWKEGF